MSSFLLFKRIASIKIQKVAIYDSYRKIINLISNKLFRYYNLTILSHWLFFDAIVCSWYFIIFVICFIYNAHKTTFCNHSKHQEERHLTANYFGVSMNIGCNIWMICFKFNRLFYDPSWILQLSEFVCTLHSSV